MSETEYRTNNEIFKEVLSRIFGEGNWIGNIESYNEKIQHNINLFIDRQKELELTDEKITSSLRAAIRNNQRFSLLRRTVVKKRRSSLQTDALQDLVKYIRTEADLTDKGIFSNEKSREEILKRVQSFSKEHLSDIC